MYNTTVIRQTARGVRKNKFSCDIHHTFTYFYIFVQEPQPDEQAQL